MTEQATQGVGSKAEGALSTSTQGILGTIEGWGYWIAQKGMSVMDSIFPPDKRAAVLAKIQAFMLKNPKLSAFLGMNLALTGIPLGLFILFTIAVTVFALLVGLIIGLLTAVLFIVFMVGTALVIVLPTVFFTTMAATFLFLWGLGGYYILKWANGDKKGSDGAGDGPAVGDMLNNVTGGRLTGFMNAARGERAKGDISGFGDKYNPPKHVENGKPAGGTQNGAPADAQKQVGETVNPASGHANGMAKKGADVSDTVNDGLRGATGLG